MTRPVSDNLLTANYPTTEIPALNERSGVSLNTYSAIGALAEKIADFVAALFHYIASFFTCCSSTEPAGQSDDFLHPHLSSYLQYLGIRNREALDTYLTFDPTNRERLLCNLSHRLVYDLIRSVPNPTTSPSFPRFAIDTSSGETFKTSINALRQSYRKLNSDTDRYHINVLYNDLHVCLYEHREPCSAFVKRAEQLANRLREHRDFRVYVNEAINSFSL